MSQPQPSYSLNDVLLLLGQCTVELAYLRGRVAELERKLDQADLGEPSNGLVVEGVPSKVP